MWWINVAPHPTMELPEVSSEQAETSAMLLTDLSDVGISVPWPRACQWLFLTKWSLYKAKSEVSLLIGAIVER